MGYEWMFANTLVHELCVSTFSLAILTPQSTILTEIPSMLCGWQSVPEKVCSGPLSLISRTRLSLNSDMRWSAR